MCSFFNMVVGIQIVDKVFVCVLLMPSSIGYVTTIQYDS